MKSIAAIASERANLSYLDIDLNQRNNYCPFIRPGSLALVAMYCVCSTWPIVSRVPNG